MQEIGLKRSASMAVRTVLALPVTASRGRKRGRAVINERNTIVFFVILFVVAIALGFATYAMASGV